MTRQVVDLVGSLVTLLCIGYTMPSSVVVLWVLAWRVKRTKGSIDADMWIGLLLWTGFVIVLAFAAWYNTLPSGAP